MSQVLRKKDAAFSIRFDRAVELLQDLTSSRPKLEDALDSLRTPAPRAEDNSQDSGGAGPRGGGTPVVGEGVGCKEVERRSITGFIWRLMN